MRRRETLDIPATAANIKYAARLRAEVQNAIERGTFDYGKFFPKSKHADKPNLAPAAAVPTIPELIETRIQRARQTGSLSPSSIKSYAGWLRARIKPKWDGRPADKVTTAELRDWIAELCGAKLTPKSIRCCINVVASTLTEAAADETIKSNPMDPISLRTLLPKRRSKESRDYVDPFNSEEIAQILAAASKPEERAMIQFAFSTGVRICELLALKWETVDLANGYVRIEDALVSAEKGAVEKETKTEGSERDIPLLPGSMASIQAMRSISGMRSAYVFTHPSHRGRWSCEQQYRNRWRIILKHAKVRYRNPYQTRHTFASTLLINGEPELLVAKLLGHESVEMIRKHYARWIKQPDGIKLRSDYKELGAHLGQAATGNPDKTQDQKKKTA